MTSKDHILGASQSFPKTIAALAYAERLHAGQRRQADGAPFILHPLEVCCLLYHTGAPDHVIAAGVLRRHDREDQRQCRRPQDALRFDDRDASARRQRGPAHPRLRATQSGITRAGRRRWPGDADGVRGRQDLKGSRTEPREGADSSIASATSRGQRQRDRKLAHYRRCRSVEQPLTTRRSSHSYGQNRDPPGISKWPGRTSRRRTSLAQGEIRWDLVTEGPRLLVEDDGEPGVATSDTTHITIPGWS